MAVTKSYKMVVGDNSGRFGYTASAGVGTLTPDTWELDTDKISYIYCVGGTTFQIRSDGRRMWNNADVIWFTSPGMDAITANQVGVGYNIVGDSTDSNFQSWYNYFSNNVGKEIEFTISDRPPPKKHDKIFQIATGVYFWDKHVPTPAEIGTYSKVELDELLSSSGPVVSVNGKTGVIVLSPEDVGTYSKQEIDDMIATGGGGGGGAGGVSVGTVVAFLTSKVPPGFLQCNGSAFSTDKYPELYKLLGKGTLPNLTDRYLKMIGNDLSVGESKSWSMPKYVYEDNEVTRVPESIEVDRYGVIYAIKATPSADISAEIIEDLRIQIASKISSLSDIAPKNNNADSVGPGYRFYEMVGSKLNAPASAGSGNLISLARDYDTSMLYGSQLFLDGDNMWMRGAVEGTFRAWEKIFHTGNPPSASSIGALSLAGGIVQSDPPLNKPVLEVKQTGVASNTGTFLVRHNGRTSWGVVGEFRTGFSNSAGGSSAESMDRPSIRFTSEASTTSWTVGMGGAAYDDTDTFNNNFAICFDRGLASGRVIGSSGGWGYTAISYSTYSHTTAVRAGMSATTYLTRSRVSKGPKANARPISGALGDVCKLQGVVGLTKEDNVAAELDLSSLERTFPHAVDSRPDGGIAYSEIIPFLVEAIKELRAEIYSLKN